MATRPTLNVAVAGTKNTATKYNENFDLMMDFIDASIDEAKDYVDGYMPEMSASTSGKFLTNNGTTASWVSITGTVIYYGGSYAPDGWLVCDGSAISRSTYANLYSAIGTAYGEGDGSTTFNLPDLLDKFAEGSSTVGTEKEAGLPNITGGIDMLVTYKNDTAYTGAFDTTWSGTWKKSGVDQTLWNSNMVFDASKSSEIYGNSETVQPEAVTFLPIIKY